MKRRNVSGMRSAAGNAGGGRTPRGSAGRVIRAGRPRVAGAWIVVGGPLALVAALALAGCGAGADHESSQEAGGTGAAAVQPQAAVPAVQAEANGAKVVETDAGAPVEAAQAAAAPKGDAVEVPDVSVSVSDTAAAPGTTVQLTARATPDARQLVLWDGIGDRVPFTHDDAAGVWRAAYRVPLEPRWKRIGLSVTAWNDSNRWRRVWTFVRVTDSRDSEGSGSPEETGPPVGPGS